MDLYDPGTGSQVHDFNAGIASSGLFWTVLAPENAFEQRGQTIRFHVADLPVVDSFVFLGPTEVPGTVSFDISWTAQGAVRHLRPGSSDPADPTNLAGEFRDAVMVGSFSGSNTDGFSFTAIGVSSAPVWAELGRERNGWFLAH